MDELIQPQGFEPLERIEVTAENRYKRLVRKLGWLGLHGHRRLEVEVKSNYPFQSGITPTAGGIVFFGDMGGNLYARDATNGQRLWGQKIRGAVIILYRERSTKSARRSRVYLDPANCTSPTMLVAPGDVALGRLRGQRA